MSARKFCSLCVALALPLSTHAAQWRLLPQVGLGADTDSNRRLQANAQATESAVLGGSLAIARLTEISQFALTPRVSVARYSGEDALDSEDFGVSAAWRRSGERMLLDLQAGFADDSTLITELGETGFVQANTRRRSWSGNFALTQLIATRHSLRYALGTSDIDYQQTAGTGLVGYRYPSASLNYSFEASPRLSWLVSFNATRLTVPDTGYESDTRGAQLGARLRLSESFELQASTGRSRSTARDRTQGEQSFEASLSWHDELATCEFSASRQVEPSGRGVLVNADNLRFSYTRNLSEKLSMDSSLRLSRREDLGAGSNDYRYGAAVLGLAMKLDENWTVALAAAYSRQDYELSAGDAAGYRAGLNLLWRPQ